MDELCLSLARQLQESDATAGLSELAQLLSSCEPEHEEEVCAAIETSGVLREMMHGLSRGLGESQQCLALSALVNLADVVGGSELVLRHGGFQLLLALVNAAEPDTRYYACAGIQNVRAPSARFRPARARLAPLMASTRAPLVPHSPVSRAQMTSNPFLLSAFVADGADGFPSIEEAKATLAAQLERDDADEALEHVARCAAGALANLSAVSIAKEYVEAIDDFDHAEPEDDDGRPPSVPAPPGARRGSLEDKLERALAARLAYEAQVAEHEGKSASVLQRRLRARRAARDDADAAAAPNDSVDELALATSSEHLLARASVRAAAEGAASALRDDRSDFDVYLAKVQYAVLALAQHLTEVVGADDEVLCRARSRPHRDRSRQARWWLHRPSLIASRCVASVCVARPHTLFSRIRPPQRLVPSRAPAPALACGEQASAVECVRECGVLGPLLFLLLEHLQAADRRLVDLGLSVLVNLAAFGGAQLVHAHGGLELMLGLLRDSDLSVRYCAVAGVQNMTATAECALRVRGTPAERLLEVMLDSGNEQIERCAAGALANIRRASREVREAAAATAAGDVAQPASGVALAPSTSVRGDAPKQEGGHEAKQRHTNAAAAAATVQRSTCGAARPDADDALPPDTAQSTSSVGGGDLPLLDTLSALSMASLGLVYRLTLGPFLRAQAT